MYTFKNNATTQTHITRGAREQLTVELDREYDRRSLGARQRTSISHQPSKATWHLRAGVEAVSQHERLAEMVVELAPATLAIIVDSLNNNALSFSYLQSRLGAAEAGIVANRLGLAGIAILDGDSFVVTNRGRRFISAFIPELA